MLQVRSFVIFFILWLTTAEATSISARSPSGQVGHVPARRPVWAGATQTVVLPPDQPFASYWFPKELLSWSPATDPNAAFNRSNTPLASRFVTAALNVNAHARSDEAKIVSLVAFHPTSNNPSQGSLTMNYYAVNYWQYMDVLVFWGGSAGEGLILAPNPTVIDAAHRNGVPVLGNIFFPPSVYGGQLQWVRDLLQKDGSRFPVADKLIEVAQYYGFDGWFINQETEGADSALAADMRDFIKYIKSRSSLRIMWYDAMIENGAIAWQNALNSSNDMFFHDNGPVADEMFLNFRWSTRLLANSRSYAQMLGRSPYDLYAGLNVEATGYNRTVLWTAIFPEGQPHVVSLGFYRPEWTYNISTGPADFYQRDNRFWIGENRDPSNTTGTSSWRGIAHFIPAKSPITQLPFVTNFNTGHGRSYAINGQTLAPGEWNNLSTQDILPTWRWIVESAGSKLVPELDWDDAYYGGTSLKIAGRLDAANRLKLYQTRLPISDDTNLRIAFKTGSVQSPTYMKVSLAFDDDPTRFHDLPVGATTTADWNVTTFNLATFAGKTLAVIALQFQSDQVVNDYLIRIGQIAIYNGSIQAPAPPSGVVVEKRTDIDTTRATLRLKWKHSPDSIYIYNVYRRNPDNSLTYLGSTPNNAYFVAEVKRLGSELETIIEVEAVGPAFGHSTHATAQFQWDTTKGRGLEL